jgi:site-specific recombinase XerD
LHDLIPLDQLPSGTLTVAEIDAAMGYAAAEKAPATREAYDSDWKDFAAWCALRGAVPLPAHKGIVAAYLSHLADNGRKASTIARRCAAIADRHRMAGIEPIPTQSEGVRAVLRGIRRTIGTAREQKTAATAAIVREMMNLCPDTVIGLRDRALLSFGLASAMRRSELCALMVADLSETPDGLRVLIRRSKTDQEGQGQEIAVPRGLKLCPVASLQAWLQAAEITTGHVFRPVAKGGQVSTEALRPSGLARIVKKLAARAGLDPKGFAGHSLRSGFVTSAVESNAPLMKIAEQTRHKSLQMLQVYSRRVDLFRDHAGAGFL